MRNSAGLRRRPAKLFLRCSFALVVFLAATVLPPSRAQSQSASSALKPELEPLSYFLGQWGCAGEFPASHKLISSRIVFSPELDGSWLAFRWDDNPPNQFHALELWGVDKTTHHFTNSIYDNFGGMRIFQSAGWIRDQLIWGPRDLPPNSPIASEQFVIDRKSKKEFVISWEVRKTQAQQQWIVGDTLTCKQE
jgi:hypothetical protein